MLRHPKLQTKARRATHISPPDSCKALQVVNGLGQSQQQQTAILCLPWGQERRLPFQQSAMIPRLRQASETRSDEVSPVSPG